jgi:hypothetical protein
MRGRAKQKFAALMSQIATSNSGRGGRRKLHYNHEKAKLVYAGTLAFIGDARAVLETIDARNA